jgi:bacteriorhodopsin
MLAYLFIIFILFCIIFEGVKNQNTLYILSLVSLFSLYIYVFILSHLDLLYVHCLSYLL